MTRFARITAAAMLLTAAACGRTDDPPAATAGSATGQWNVAITPSDVGSPAGSVEPQLTASANGSVVLSWVEVDDGVATLRYAERTGKAWSAARTAASGDDWFVSWADVPAVMRLADGTLVAQWLKNVDPTIEAYDLQLSSSRDSGKTWTKPFTPHHDGTKTQHGFATLLELPDSGLGMVWLDGRQQELDTRSQDGGSMSIRFATYDRQWKQTADMVVDERVCECCPTTAAVTADGIITAFRDRSPREIRDIHVSRLEKGAWTYATPVHVDGWEIEACPVNGPAIDASGRNAVVAWFTAKDDKPQAFAAFSSDAGRTWGAPIRLDDASTLGHVDIELLEDGSAVAAWVEFADSRPSLRIRRIETSGMRSQPVVVAGDGEHRVTGIPRLAAHGDEIVLAWTEAGAAADGREQVKVATVKP
jgi:hypothetical protein